MGTVACNVYGPWLLPPVIIGCVTCHLCPNYSNFGALQSSLSHLLMQERRPLGENPLLLQLSIICSLIISPAFHSICWNLLGCSLWLALFHALIVRIRRPMQGRVTQSFQTARTWVWAPVQSI